MPFSLINLFRSHSSSQTLSIAPQPETEFSEPIYCSPRVRPWTAECAQFAKKLNAKNARTMVRVPQLPDHGWFDCFDRRGEELGHGAYKSVSTIVDKKGQKFARAVTSYDLGTAEEEAALMMRVQGPGVAKVISSGYFFDDEGKKFAMIEKLYTGAIHDMFETLSSPDRERIGNQIIESVAEMHEKGVAHQDLHAGNILLDQANNPVINDFGLASDHSKCPCPDFDSARIRDREMLENWILAPLGRKEGLKWDTSRLVVVKKPSPPPPPPPSLPNRLSDLAFSMLNSMTLG
jgi:serine/threonine protein kinase